MADLDPHTIRPFLTEQHRDFFPLLALVVVGTVDRAGNAWATLRCGHPGFAHSPDPLHLRLTTLQDDQDPAEAGMGSDDAVGLLGIDLATRRCNRLSGRIEGRTAEGFSVAVGQSFGDCPQYIQCRAFEFHRPPNVVSPERARAMASLDDRALEVIAASDCFFVARYADLETGHRQVDVLHRGGKPGFVEVDEDGLVTVPDYRGDHFFSTPGNNMLNGRVGLTFIDFHTGDLLQITGVADVDLEPDASFGIAERVWRVKPEAIVYRPLGLPLRRDDIAPIEPRE